MATSSSTLSSLLSPPGQAQQRGTIKTSALNSLPSSSNQQSKSEEVVSLKHSTDDDANDANDGTSSQTTREKTDKVTLEGMMKYAEGTMKLLSCSAQLPKKKDIHSFASLLLDLKLPIWKDILRNFVLGVAVLDYKMHPEMFSLCVDMFSQGQLGWIVQEDRVDLMSMNIRYKGNLRLVFLSEVSSSFFRQLIGRCGRVSSGGNEDFGIVECMTPSGVIVLPQSEELECSDAALSQHICSFDEFNEQFSFIKPRALVREIHSFLSSCRLNEKENRFFKHQIGRAHV